MSDFQKWSVLAFRAMDDAGRVLMTIEPESTSEGERLDQLKETIRELLTQALLLNGVVTRRQLDERFHFGKLDTDALNAQLARPAQEPFGYFRAEPFGWTDCAETDEGAVALYERPRAAQPEQEPVAWMSDMGSIASMEEKKMGYVLESAFTIPLYTAAAQPEPKTCLWLPEDDDTMPGTYRSACGELWSFIEGGWQENQVRFCHGCGGKVVDGAHGIKEPKP